MSQNSDIQQLTQTVAVLAQSLEQSQQSVRRTQRLFFATVMLIVFSMAAVLMTNTNMIRSAHANQQPGIEQILQGLLPVLADAGTLVKRLKQDSDIVRAKSLMKAYPEKYPPGTSMDKFTAQELNSFEASNALIVGGVASEIHLLNDSLKRITYAIEVITHDVNGTIGRVANFFP